MNKIRNTISSLERLVLNFVHFRIHLSKNSLLIPPFILKVHGTFSLGRSSFISPSSRIVVAKEAGLCIGRMTYIGKNSTIVAFSDISIGDTTLIGENVSIHSENHGLYPNARDDYDSNPISIGDNVWIGSGVIILPGVHIGQNTTVGANAVVTHSIPPNSIAVGVPAKVIRTYESE